MSIVWSPAAASPTMAAIGIPHATAGSDLAKLVRGKLRRLDQVVPKAAWGKPWVVHCTAWGEGDEAALRYLARYVFRVAITNSRIVGATLLLGKARQHEAAGAGASTSTHQPSASPTNRRSILPISSALSASAALMAAAACFDVLVFDPKTTVPPITAEIAAIVAIESNVMAPNVKANSHIPPAAMATFETIIIFRQLSMTSVSSSI
jgi:Putative transposase